MYHWPTQQKNSTTATFQYCRSSILKFFLYGALFYAVSTCEAASHGWTFSHHQSLTTRNRLSGFNCTFRPWKHVHRLHSALCWTTIPCDLSVYRDECSINSKIKNKVNLGSTLIFNLIFQKINLYWSVLKVEVIRVIICKNANVLSISIPVYLYGSS